ALPACGPLGSAAAQFLDDAPEGVKPPRGDAVDPVFHLLARAAYGARPGDVERVGAMGRDAWLAEQFAPDSIDDAACDLRLSDCELAQDEPLDLMSVDPRHVDRHLTRATLIRAVHSRRRVLETTVGFWNDH